MHVVTAIEILEDLTESTVPPAERFLNVKRLRAQNLRADGTRSVEYRIDVVDRPGLDAVALLLYRRGPRGLEVLTRRNLRPAAYFRTGKASAFGRETGRLEVEEIVAGVLESTDVGEEGVIARAVAEAREEAGVMLRADQVRMLGGPFFVAPGIISEQIFLCCADCTDAGSVTPTTDGSPLEEGGALRWWSAHGLLDACRRGDVRDAKTELALTRLLYP